MTEKNDGFKYFLRTGSASKKESLYRYKAGQGYRWVDGDWEENMAVADAICGEGSWQEYDEVTENFANAWLTNQPD
jgi:hypothetical protein